MSLSSATSRVSYTGTGSTSVYAYTFKIFSASQLRVTRRVSGAETLLVLNTDYTVSGVGNASGGNVTLSGNLALNAVLVIRRVASLVQETDIRNQGAFYPEIHEDSFDLLTMMAQQLSDDASRSMKLPETITSVAFDPTLPTDITNSANRVILINPSSNGFIQGPTASQIINAESFSDDAADSAELAEDWATKTDGTVDGSEFSAKYYAQVAQAVSFGTTGSPRTIAAAVGITSGASHMSTSNGRQAILCQGPSAGITAITANPQIEAHTIVGSYMTLTIESASDFFSLDTGNGLRLTGVWSGDFIGASITLMWNGSLWVEVYRNN